MGPKSRKSLRVHDLKRRHYDLKVEVYQGINHVVSLWGGVWDVA